MPVTKEQVEKIIRDRGLPEDIYKASLGSDENFGISISSEIKGVSFNKYRNKFKLACTDIERLIAEEYESIPKIQLSLADIPDPMLDNFSPVGSHSFFAPRIPLIAPFEEIRKELIKFAKAKHYKEGKGEVIFIDGVLYNLPRNAADMWHNIENNTKSLENENSPRIKYKVKKAIQTSCNAAKSLLSINAWWGRKPSATALYELIDLIMSNYDAKANQHNPALTNADYDEKKNFGVS